jgi:hypothetical protein
MSLKNADSPKSIRALETIWEKKSKSSKPSGKIKTDIVWNFMNLTFIILCNILHICR